MHIFAQILRAASEDFQSLYGDHIEAYLNRIKGAFDSSQRFMRAIECFVLCEIYVFITRRSLWFQLMFIALPSLLLYLTVTACSYLASRRKKYQCSNARKPFSYSPADLWQEVEPMRVERPLNVTVDDDLNIEYFDLPNGIRIAYTQAVNDRRIVGSYDFTVLIPDFHLEELGQSIDERYLGSQVLILHLSSLGKSDFVTGMSLEDTIDLHLLTISYFLTSVIPSLVSNNDSSVNVVAVGYGCDLMLALTKKDLQNAPISEFNVTLNKNNLFQYRLPLRELSFYDSITFVEPRFPYFDEFFTLKEQLITVAMLSLPLLGKSILKAPIVYKPYYDLRVKSDLLLSISTYTSLKREPLASDTNLQNTYLDRIQRIPYLRLLEQAKRSFGLVKLTKFQGTNEEIILTKSLLEGSQLNDHIQDEFADAKQRKDSTLFSVGSFSSWFKRDSTNTENSVSSQSSFETVTQRNIMTKQEAMFAAPDLRSKLPQGSTRVEIVTSNKGLMDWWKRNASTQYDIRVTKIIY